MGCVCVGGGVVLLQASLMTEYFLDFEAVRLPSVLTDHKTDRYGNYHCDLYLEVQIPSALPVICR